MKPKSDGVTIHEVTDANFLALLRKYQVPGIDLHRKVAELSVRRHLSDHLVSGGKAFLLFWRGNKTPVGATILGHQVTLATEGQIVSDTVHLGMFDRLICFGTRPQNVQLIVVYASPTLSTGA